jgi:hypothetical protein
MASRSMWPSGLQPCRTLSHHVVPLLRLVLPPLLLSAA